MLSAELKSRGVAGRSAGFALMLMILLFCAPVVAAPKGVVLHNGKIFTAEPTSPWAQAVAIVDGRVADVGSDAEVLAKSWPGMARIDLGGRTVVPGLNDAHVHVLYPPSTQINTRDFVPGPGPTLPDVLGQIQAATAAYPAGTWLVAFVGTNVTEDENANRFALDAVAPDHPVRLQAWWGHGTILNSKALEALGIAPDAPDPFGGVYDRASDGETLDGVVHEYAEYRIWRKLYASASDADLAAQYKAFASVAVQLGFTSLQDMAVGLPYKRAAEVLEQAHLSVRVRAICFPLTPEDSCETSNDGDEMVRHSGIKWITDGTPLERFAFVRESYADDPDWFGRFDLPESALEGQLLRSLLGPRETHQILFHAVGDGAIGRILDGLEALGGRAAWGDRRPRIEHGDLLFPENIPRVADVGALVVQNGTHLALTATFEDRYSPARVAEMEPLKSLLDAGIPLALGTDAIGAPQSPWLDIFFTVVHPTHPAEAISVEEAVAAYTRGSAYAEFEEGRKGTLSPGKKADLAVLSQDVFSVPVQMIPATTSVLTMVGGEVVWDAGVIGN